MSEFPRNPTRSQIERSQAIRSVVHGIVDVHTAHEGREDLPIALIGSPTPLEGAVMGFTPQGEFDVQYTDGTLADQVIPQLPSTQEGFDWESYVYGING